MNNLVQVKAISEFPDNKRRQALTFAVSACRIDPHCLGWLPTLAYEQAAEANRIIICTNNDDIVGMVMYGTNLDRLKIYQTWVRPDARLILHGKALCTWLERRAVKEKKRSITLWCATDLPANLFWSAMGFEKRTWRHGRKTSNRRHWLWVKNLLPTMHNATQRSLQPA